MAAKAKPLTIRTLDEANDALIRLGEVERELEHRDLALKDEVNRLHAAARAGAAPAETLQATLLNALQDFANANRTLITGGANIGVRSLPAGEIGWRVGRARVELPEDKAELKKLLALLVAEHPRFVRTKHEVNKQVLKAEPDLARTLPGVRVTEGDAEFVCAPLTGEVR